MASATSNPPATTLGNVQVQIKDSTGTTRNAPIFDVSPTQISFQNPQGTALGAATITVVQGGNNVATGATLVESVTPGLFAANASGSGVAAATAIRVSSDGTQTMVPVYQYNSWTSQFSAVPVDVSSGQVYLLLFGTGFRNASSLAMSARQ